MSMAKNALIPCIVRKWSEQAVDAFAQFFTKLELRPYRQQEFGEQAILVYQARARGERHKMKTRNGFNIGAINEELYIDKFYRDILDRARINSIVTPSHLPFSSIH